MLYLQLLIQQIQTFPNWSRWQIQNPKSRVILNEFETDYFDCPIGVKQGDCLSPTLFALFINDLAEEIKSSGVGLELDSDTFINILLYADDIVLLAKNEEDLQFLLDIVETWK